MSQRHCFFAMGTEVELLLEAAPGVESALALLGAEREIRRLEAALSRFRPDSELSELNREGAIEAGPDLVRVTGLALEARERTGGRFDPTVHDALVAAGYDRSFEEVPPDGASSPSERTPCGGGVRIDQAKGRIELEPGVRLDLGGIAKGYAVDRACELLARAGDCLANAGGDVAVHGSWPIGVEMAKGTLTLALDRGALATSGRDRRRWRRDGEERHHIIDPTTGRPAASDLLRVTAFGETAVEAEVLAKALFLAGAEEAEREAARLDVPCVLVTGEGRTVLAGSLR